MTSLKLWAALFLMTASLGLVGSVPSSGGADLPVSIHMSLVDEESPGMFWTNDVLRLTVQVFVGGTRTRVGITDLTTNDLQERELCEVSALPFGGDYCNIDIPNPGTWKIQARFARVDTWPEHYTSSKMIRVKITRPTPTTTEPQIYDQPTQVEFSSDSYNLETAGVYYPIEDAGVIVTGSGGSAFPGGGSITFTDASGRVICSTQVVADLVAGCEGSPVASPPPNPVTAYYSGTQAGVDDGAGSTYAPSSAPAYVPTA
jgi:hypothetical protein